MRSILGINESIANMNNYRMLMRMSCCWVLFVGFCTMSVGQNLMLKDAVEQGVANYGLLTAKSKYAMAANETIEQIKMDYLPNLNLSAQQDYGTVNGQNGPLYGFGGLGVGSSGLPLAYQNWNAAFGSLYLINANWEIFTFGRIKQRVNVAKADAERYQKDYEQEVFQHKIRISAAYLNLLASQRLLGSQQKNLERAGVFYQNVAVRVTNGLLPGVDSTLAAAEISRAKIVLNQLREQLKVQNNDLVQLMGQTPQNFVTDTTLINRLPKVVEQGDPASDTQNHPTRQFFKSRILLSQEQERFFKKEFLPSISLVGIYQTRGSGFNANYSADQTSYSQSYFEGITPSRQNYLIGLGASWNLTNILRSRKKIRYQSLMSLGLQDEYKAVDTELLAREDAANARLDLALQSYREAPKQVAAAQQAYLQRTTLYNNGLTTLTDVMTAAYTLNRAETDRDIAFTNVWEALLMKAAAIGDFGLFINEF
jgi:outer membrane protein TolC